ncbi:hypothetical protein [Frankia sp. ACN1ag]|uniref:hypothetical protein n=1 Tax=Frankia sp. ACN1ag TaxID=102891 RepID=UPI000FF88452|nr:hypothetical protein [Frankia sp. ACN1ag]
MEHNERQRLAEQEAAKERRNMDQRRNCYVQLNANDRNYRDAMLAYAYALKAESAGEAEAAEVAAARRAQRDSRAEAQMTASDEVLNSEGGINAQLTEAYRLLKQIERASDANTREPLLEEVIELLDEIILMMSRMRAIMRIELAITDRSPFED